MSTDLERVLSEAAAQAPPPDVDAILSAGLRRRRRRNVARAATGAVAVLAAVAIGVTLLPSTGRKVDFADTTTTPSWPLALRYEREHREGVEPTSGRFVGEFAANNWDDWIHVSPMDGHTAYVERWGPGGRHGGAEVDASATAPFELLGAAADVSLSEIEPVEPDLPPTRPSDLLHPERFGQEPDPRDVTVVAEDLPELRDAVAQRLSLDATTLRAVRTEEQMCTGTCGVQRHTYVWVPSLELPLYVEELDPDGARFALKVTHIELGMAPPPNLLPSPAPVPPPMPSEPVSEGFAFREPYTEFDVNRGTWLGATVLNVDDQPLRVPDRYLFERWSGDAWHPVAALRADDRTTEPLDPRRTRRLTVLLPEEVTPGWHRLKVNVADLPPTTIDQFYYSGDPNQ